jgi:hypothetical protein
MPQRFQRSRRKGARLPAGVVVVTRPTKWGNPHTLELGREEAVLRYHEDLLAGRLAVTVEDARRELRGARPRVLLPAQRTLPRRRAASGRQWVSRRRWGHMCREPRHTSDNVAV